MFNNCSYEFVCEQSCADHHCMRGCDHGADVAVVTMTVLAC